MTAFKDFLNKHGDPERINFHIDCQLCYRTENNIDEILQRILDWAKSNNLNNDEKISIAEILFKANRKVESVEWIKDIPQPPLFLYTTITAIKHELGEDTLALFRQRIRLNRLLSALGKSLEPETAVPGDKRLEVNTVLERLIVLIANTWGRAWGGEIIPPAELMRKLRPAIDIVQKKWKDDIFLLWEGSLKRIIIPGYFSLMIQAVSVHGYGVLKELGNILEARWSSDEEKQYWELSWRIHIAGELFHTESRFHQDNTRAKKAYFKRLSSIETELLCHEQPFEEGEAGAKLALGWLVLEEPGRAQALMQKIFETSFALRHEKGYEFTMWVKWLGQLDFLGKEDMEEHIRRFANAFAAVKPNSLHETVEKFQSTGSELLQMAASRDTGIASTLQDWFLDRGLIHYTTAVESMIMVALNTPDPPLELAFSIARHLLVPFRFNCNQKLIETLVSRCIEKRSNDEGRLLLESLNTTILTGTFPSRRSQWLEALRNGCRQAGFDTTWIKSGLEPVSKGEAQAQPSHLILKSGETISEEEAINRINSYEDILEILNQIDKSERFHWGKVLRQIIDEFDEYQVKELKKELEKFRIGGTVTILLAKRLASLGYIDDALKLAGGTGKTETFCLGEL